MPIQPLGGAAVGVLTPTQGAFQKGLETATQAAQLPSLQQYQEQRLLQMELKPIVDLLNADQPEAAAHLYNTNPRIPKPGGPVEFKQRRGKTSVFRVKGTGEIFEYEPNQGLRKVGSITPEPPKAAAARRGVIRTTARGIELFDPTIEGPVTGVSRGVIGQPPPKEQPAPARERAPTTNELALQATNPEGTPESRERAGRALIASGGIGRYLAALARRAGGARVSDPDVARMTEQEARKQLAVLGRLDVIKGAIANALPEENLPSGWKIKPKVTE